MSEEMNDRLDRKENKKSFVGNGIIYGFIAGMLFFAVTRETRWLGIGISLGILIAAVMEMQENRKQKEQQKENQQ